jgi:hypothetical protein
MAVDPKRFRLQLFSERWAHRIRLDLPNLVHQRVTDGVLGLLVEDTGGGELTVSRARVAHLGSDAQLLALGRQQSVAADLQHVVLAQTGPFEVAASNGFYLGACLLDQASLMPAPGVLVAMISWHHWVMLRLGAPVTRAELGQMRELIAIVAEEAIYNSATGGDRIGTEIYWLRGTELGVRMVFEADGRVRIPAGLESAIVG